MKSIAGISSMILLTASMVLADATVQQKTQLHFGGAIGGVINVFGRSATHEGVVNDIAIYKNRKSTRTGDTGEIIDLDEQKIYHVNYAKKTYEVVTFAELRQQYEESKEKAKRQQASASKNEQSNAPEYEVEFSIKSTGNKEEINGWKARQEIATVTVHEKGKTLEDAGGFVLTSDMWLAPRVPAMREMMEFDRKFVQKVYGDSFASDMRQAAAMMAATPAFAKAMKTMNEKQGSLDGTAVRTKMTFEMVAGKNASSDQQQSPAVAIGGLLGRMKRRGGEQSSSGAQRSTMLDSNHELLKASTTASAADVAIPAGFKLRS
jgi:hypothetical protein